MIFGRTLNRSGVSLLTPITGIAILFLSETLTFWSSGTLHQWPGVFVMNSWLKAQNPQGKQAGKHINHKSCFWYQPNSPKTNRSSSRSKFTCTHRNEWLELLSTIDGTLKHTFFIQLLHYLTIYSSIYSYLSSYTARGMCLKNYRSFYLFLHGLLGCRENGPRSIRRFLL